MFYEKSSNFSNNHDRSRMVAEPDWFISGKHNQTFLIRLYFCLMAHKLCATLIILGKIISGNWTRNAKIFRTKIIFSVLRKIIPKDKIFLNYFFNRVEKIILKYFLKKVRKYFFFKIIFSAEPGNNSKKYYFLKLFFRKSEKIISKYFLRKVWK